MVVGLKLRTCCRSYVNAVFAVARVGFFAEYNFSRQWFVGAAERGSRILVVSSQLPSTVENCKDCKEFRKPNVRF